MFFQDTIEERVAAVVSLKLRCLSKVVRQRESWESIILGAKDGDDTVATKLVEEAEKQIELVTDEDDAMLTIEDEEEE
jgi:DNA-dependent RNA polymerase auxiliary subunit epsilon